MFTAVLTDCAWKTRNSLKGIVKKIEFNAHPLTCYPSKSELEAIVPLNLLQKYLDANPEIETNMRGSLIGCEISYQDEILTSYRATYYDEETRKWVISRILVIVPGSFQSGYKGDKVVGAYFQNIGAA